MAVTLSQKTAERLAAQAAAARARAEANPTASNLTTAARLESMAQGKTMKEASKDVAAVRTDITAQNNAAKAEERAQIDHLQTVQLGEIDALRATAKDQGLTSTEIAKLVAAESRANAAELAAARTRLNTQVGLQTLSEQGLLGIRSAPNAYSGDLATGVAGLMDTVANNFQKYNFATYRDMDKDAFSGATFNGIMRAELTRDQNGQIAGKDFWSNFLRNAENNYGKALTADQIGGKLSQVGGETNLFKTTAGTKNQISTYFTQNPDGTYTAVGYDHFRPDRGVGIGATLREAAPAIVASYFLTPMLASGLNIPNAAAAALVSGTKTAIGGGNFEDILTSAATSGAGAAIGQGLVSSPADATGAFDIGGATGAFEIGTAGAFDQGGLADLLTNVPEAASTTGAVLPPVDYSLTAGATFPMQGMTATLPPLPEATDIGIAPIDYSLSPQTIPGVIGGQGLVLPELPNLGGMGGGQGLSVSLPGGTVTEQGFIPTGATPVLGDPSSFINNPDVLGTPVLPTGTGFTLSLKDILNTVRIGNTLTNLLGDKTAKQQLQPQQMPMPYGYDYTGVDYSGLLNLLSQRAKRADVASLLG